MVKIVKNTTETKKNAIGTEKRKAVEKGASRAKDQALLNQRLIIQKDQQIKAATATVATTTATKATSYSQTQPEKKTTDKFEATNSVKKFNEKEETKEERKVDTQTQDVNVVEAQTQVVLPQDKNLEGAKVSSEGINVVDLKLVNLPGVERISISVGMIKNEALKYLEKNYPGTITVSLKD